MAALAGARLEDTHDEDEAQEYLSTAEPQEEEEMGRQRRRRLLEFHGDRASLEVWEKGTCLLGVVAFALALI